MSDALLLSRTIHQLYFNISKKNSFATVVEMQSTFIEVSFLIDIAMI